MSTYYERDRERVSKLDWRAAFIELYEEVLNEHMKDAYDFGKVFLESKGYKLHGESVIGPESKLKDLKNLVEDTIFPVTRERVKAILDGKERW